MKDKEQFDEKRKEAVESWKKRQEQYDREDKAGVRPPYQGKLLSEFRVALLATAIPIVVLSLISTGVHPNDALNVWFVAVGLFGIALITAIVLTIIGKSEIAGGMWAGIAIGFVSLGATCFANLATI